MEVKQQPGRFRMHHRSMEDSTIENSTKAAQIVLVLERMQLPCNINKEGGR